MVRLVMKIDPVMTLIGLITATWLGYSALNADGRSRGSASASAGDHPDCPYCRLPRYSESGAGSRSGPDPGSSAIETVLLPDGHSYRRRVPLGAGSPAAARKGPTARGIGDGRAILDRVEAR